MATCKKIIPDLYGKVIPDLYADLYAVCGPDPAIAAADADITAAVGRLSTWSSSGWTAPIATANLAEDGLAPVFQTSLTTAVADSSITITIRNPLTVNPTTGTTVVKMTIELSKAPGTTQIVEKDVTVHWAPRVVKK